ncbi:MAG: methyltransferase [Mollicutes bacterium]|nr:methyltransferase [Mollicutes bacterium]
MLQKNDLFDYENRYIYQDGDFFKFSLDSILLAEYVDLPLDNKNIVDFCSGNMVVPLILSTYTNSKITGFEIQSEIYKLGLKSIKLNKLEKKLAIINDDVRNIKNYFSKGQIDTITCNPPYYKISNTNLINKNKILSIARHEIKINLEEIFKISSEMLQNKGVLYLVHKCDRLDEIIYYGFMYKLNIKKVTLIKTKQKLEPSLVLVKGIKNSKPGIKIQNIICIENLKSYKNIFRKE